MSGVISYSRDFSEYVNMLSHKLRRTVQWQGVIMSLAHRQQVWVSAIDGGV